jgi:hypothetical protein
MSEKMTLEQVRDLLRFSASENVDMDALRYKMADAIDAHLATLPAASTSPDGGEAVDNATKWLIDCARRSIPFLMDEASKYDDDGSNEPLETARDIDKAIDELAAAYQAGLDQEDQARKTYAFDVLINIGHVTRHEAEAALAIAKRSLSAQRGEAES